MLQWLTLSMVVAIGLTGCRPKSFICQLRKPQNDQEYSTLHSMPDGALLVLTKRME
jgi:hypothetical protein